MSIVEGHGDVQAAFKSNQVPQGAEGVVKFYIHSPRKYFIDELLPDVNSAGVSIQ